MSPEPTQEPIEQNLSVPNLTAGARAVNESDSEDEDTGMTGYMPLSQVPTDADPMLDEDDDFEDEEWISASVERSQGLSTVLDDEQQGGPSETIQVWTSLCNRSNIELDPDKINQVKSMMATFTLPVTAIPEWANTISEEQWKEELIDRIKEMQNRET
ncbi:male-enhanced antigen 1 [Venturia canescens]|uniref:male-enhanced antigen 1 n=1 Tax=Venturia canescens TaxID=32260 RepID=UPI001C9C409E|nr:male-enhanced antigen 1 [Venturia canescens]